MIPPPDIYRQAVDVVVEEAKKPLLDMDPEELEELMTRIIDLLVSWGLRVEEKPGNSGVLGFA